MSHRQGFLRKVNETLEEKDSIKTISDKFMLSRDQLERFHVTKQNFKLHCKRLMLSKLFEGMAFLNLTVL